MEAIPRYYRQVVSTGRRERAILARPGEMRELTEPYEATALLGEALSGIGLHFHKMLDIAIANTQLDKFQLNAETKYNQLQVGLATNPDPITYDESLKKTVEDIQNNDLAKITHPLAKQKADLWFAQRTKTRTIEGQEVAGDWVKDIRIAAGQKAAKNAVDSYNAVMKASVELVNLPMAYDATQRVLESGQVPPEVAKVNFLLAEQSINKVKAKQGIFNDLIGLAIANKTWEFSAIRGNSPKVHKEWMEQYPGITEDDINEIVNDVKTSYSAQQALAKESLDKERILAEDRIFKAIDNPNIIFDSGIIDKEISLLPARRDELKEKWRDRIKSRLVISAEETDNEVKSEIDKKIYQMRTGAITKEDALKTLNEGKDKITKQDFEDREIKINAKYEDIQTDAMQMTYNRAEKQLVTMDKSAWEQFALVAKGKELENAASRRQTEYWYLSKYDDEMNSWLKKNPDATRDEIYIEGRKKLAHYRRRTSEQVSDLMKIHEAAAIVAGEPIIEIKRRIKVVAPDGKLYTIPEKQKEEAIKQGYTIVE